MPLDEDIDRRLSTLIDTSSAQEMTKSLTQLCNQVSFANIRVPRIDSFRDAFDFIVEFEALTSGLEDSQRTMLISRAFPTGCNRPWFETELVPAIKSGASWLAIRKKIIERFSSNMEHDRHIFKLRELTYDPDGEQSLLNFIEEMLFSLKKALSREDQSVWISMVKASIPEKMRPTMNMYPEFRNADTTDKLKEAAKQYDLSKGALPKAGSSREATKELASMFQEIVKSIKKDNEDTRQAVAAAFRSFETSRSSSNQNDRTYRPISPGRNEYRPVSPRESNQDRGYSSQGRQNDDFYKRSASPSRDGQYRERGRSPQRYNDYLSSNRPRNIIQGNASPSRNDQPRYRSVTDRPPTPGVKDDKNTDPNAQEEAINSKMYFARFGKPPTPCSQCQSWHWNKHCPFHLN